MPNARLAFRFRLLAALPALLVALAFAASGQARAATSQDACGAAPAGQVRCEAQVLVASRRPVHPRVKRVSSGTRARLRSRASGAAAVSEPASGTPLYLQQAYDLTALSATRGAGETVAVVDAYDDPSVASDLASFRSNFGLPACTIASGCLRVLNQDGASSPLPAPSSSWSVEESLDVDAVSALCPNCSIVVVEADQPDTQDMQQAIAAAVAAGASIVSNSWSVDSTASPFGSGLGFPGVAMIAASGDDGTAQPGQSAYPAALPNVTAVGGTELTTAAGTPRGFTESAWNGGGSGCDTTEQAPSWQPQTGCAGRAYSDISADGDPSTGLDVYDSQDGGWLVVGGTSLAAPLVAATEALTGVNGSTAQWAYSDESLLNDVTSGSDGSCSLSLICNAASGWDGPTGVGSISGAVVPGAPGVGGPDVSGAGSLGYAVSVSATGATLAGGVYPNGETTSYYWQYGKTGAYGSQTPARTVPAGTAAVSVQGALALLAPSTTYHYRLVATNASGTSYGYDFTLTTAAGSKQAKSSAKPARGKKHRKPAHGKKRAKPGHGKKHAGKAKKHAGKAKKHRRRRHDKSTRRH